MVYACVPVPPTSRLSRRLDFLVTLFCGGVGSCRARRARPRGPGALPAHAPSWLWLELEASVTVAVRPEPSGVA